MKKRKGYIFTNKKHSQRAVMAVILGLISLVSLGIVVFRSYLGAGETVAGYGFTGLLATVFSLTGLGLGIVTVKNQEYYRMFPVLGIVLNLVSLGAVSLILYAGARL